MKKIIIITIPFLLTGMFSFAHGFHFGLKAAADIHKIDGQAFKQEYNLGYSAGVFAEIKLPGKIGLQPEVYYSEVNPRPESSSSAIYGFNGITKIKLSYINIPILLNFKILPVLSFQVGPQFGIMTNKSKNILQNGKDAFKSGDVGVAAGLQVNVAKIKIFGRYVAGLNDVNNANSGKWHNQSIHVGLGIRII